MPVALRIEYRIGTQTGKQALQSLTLAMDRAGAEVARFGEYVFPRVITLMEEEETAQFSAQGHGPVAGTWAPLSARYAAAKLKRYGPKPILEATGKMKEALTSHSSPLAARQYSAMSMAFGTQGVPYASFHQTGTKGRGFTNFLKRLIGRQTGMPARPPLDFSEEFSRNMRTEAQLGLVEAVRAGDKEHLLEVTP